MVDHEKEMTHWSQQANLLVRGLAAGGDRLQDTTLLMLPGRKPGKQEKPPWRQPTRQGMSRSLEGGRLALPTGKDRNLPRQFAGCLGSRAFPQAHLKGKTL